MGLSVSSLFFIIKKVKMNRKVFFDCSLQICERYLGI